MYYQFLLETREKIISIILVFIKIYSVNNGCYTPDFLYFLQIIHVAPVLHNITRTLFQGAMCFDELFCHLH